MSMLLLDQLPGLVCAVAALLVLLPLLSKLDLLPSRGRRFPFVLLVLYIGALLQIVGLPAVPYFHFRPNINLDILSDLDNTRFLLLSGLNVALMVPLGILLPLCFPRYRRLGSVFGAGFLTSLTIELLQMFSSRATDIYDLLFNTLGACLGFTLLYWISGKRWKSYASPHRGDRTTLVISLAVTYLCYTLLHTPLSQLIWQIL